ncbi:MAG: TRAP transporter small permease subunit [Melioribacteraceae bacterium]|nr:TRAP transporter small permease subunit [Melioribacteraceae bacterium]MCF8354900.1 TRAP transporter small permease subunit [Melioribacteraceae bacterium]MCF8396043.1 TRAP transporter small permease subunit [Melioribacteraceae bacterium]MCF8421064.1 TRAP transporter small permease subunit [Melioribacteraceae bacterium]
MNLLKKASELIDKINTRIGNAVSWFTAALVLLVTYDVLARYLFNTSSVAIQELEWHLFAAIFLLGAAITLKNEAHVRVDVFYGKLSEKKKAIINITGTILFLIPFCIVLILASQNFVLTSFQIGETSPDTGGLPARYIIKAILPVSIFFLLLQSLSLLFKSILILLLKDAERT